MTTSTPSSSCPTADPVFTPGSGVFISFEGGDGTGKSTQIHRLAALLEPEFSVLTTREPGGTELGQTLRDLVQHGPEDVDPRTEALLFAADRAYHVARVIRPALERGQVVITDRYLDSSIAYQGAARGLGGDVRSLSLWATKGLIPQVTVLLDLSPAAARLRQGDALDRLEREAHEFHNSVRERYLELAQAEPQRFVVIDAAKSVEQVHSQICQALAQRFPAFQHLLPGEDL